MKLSLFILFCIFHLMSSERIVREKRSLGSSNALNRIVGGEEARNGEFPYQCLLQDGRRGFCGCSILTAHWVITAAHCVVGRKNSKRVRVKVGTNSKTQGGEEYKVAQIVIHEKYNDRYDIAVLKLERPLRFNSKVRPIAISNRRVAPRTELIASGWGQLASNKGSPDRLQKLRLKAISLEECRRQWPGLHESYMCTSTPPGQGLCMGDSGGPLVHGNTLVGLVSFGAPCATGKADVFTDVSHLNDWIRAHTDL